MQLTEWIPPPRNWENLTYHPLSEVVNFGVGIDIDELAAHMKQFGYDDGEPVVIYRDVILDGRHKHAAAKKAGVVPSFVRFVGKNPQAYVAKKALRQHLNSSQRAMLAAFLVKAPIGASGGKSLFDAAGALNVGDRSVDRASRVISHGTEALQEAVRDGTVTVTDAAKIADEPAKVQDQAVKKVRRGRTKTAADAVPKVLVDDAGTVVPAGHLTEVFKTVELFKRFGAALTNCGTIAKKIESSAAKEAKPLDPLKPFQKFYPVFQQARAKMVAMRPALVCCGDGCEKCRNKGWLTFEEAEAQK